MDPGLGIVLVLLLVVAWRVAAGGLDRGRIDRYVRDRGGRVDRVSWTPFGRGWFGEKGDRIYEVEFFDRDGTRRRASAKTSLFSGVYWSEDSAATARTPSAPRAGGAGPSAVAEADALRRENERLCDEIERMRRERERGA